MGKINSINEESVNNYQPLATHKGKTMAVDMMVSELADLQSTISGAELMVDSLLDRIKNEILAEEDRIANSI